MAKALILTGISGSKVGQQEIIADRITLIGSGPTCQFIIRDRMVLARHAEIRQVLERWFVVPLDSNAQVFINGTVIRTQGRINEGDTLTIGTATFKISVTDAIQQAAVGITESSPSRNGVPRLGEYLVKRGFTNSKQIQQAAQRQDELRSQGRRVQFGDILYELGYVSRTQLEVAVQEQRSDFYERFRD